LSETLNAVRKNGRMVSPDTVASSFKNAEKSIAVMPPPRADRSPRDPVRAPSGMRQPHL
jgi:hypothetical protein